MSRVWSMLGAAVAAVLALVLLPAPAHAASWSLAGNNQPYWAGSGTSSGTLTFNSSVKFTTSFSVTDKCPADGASVGVQFYVQFTNGSIKFEGPYWDSDGCGNGATNYSRVFNYPSTAVKRVQIILVEDDRSHPNPMINIDVSTWKDNPYT